MLVDFYSHKPITKVPFAEEYQRCLSRMTEAEIAAIKKHLNEMIDATGVTTAGWMPGPDWTATVLQLIHEKAAHRNEGLAARCFGLMVWEAVMEHQETWTSERFEKNGEEIGSRTYFRVSAAINR